MENLVAGFLKCIPSNKPTRQPTVVKDLEFKPLGKVPQTPAQVSHVNHRPNQPAQSHSQPFHTDLPERPGRSERNWHVPSEQTFERYKPTSTEYTHPEYAHPAGPPGYTRTAAPPEYTRPWCEQVPLEHLPGRVGPLPRGYPPQGSVEPRYPHDGYPEYAHPPIPLGHPYQNYSIMPTHQLYEALQYYTSVAQSQAQWYGPTRQDYQSYCDAPTDPRQERWRRQVEQYVRSEQYPPEQYPREQYPREQYPREQYPRERQDQNWERQSPPPVRRTHNPQARRHTDQAFRDVNGFVQADETWRKVVAQPAEEQVCDQAISGDHSMYQPCPPRAPEVIAERDNSTELPSSMDIVQAGGKHASTSSDDITRDQPSQGSGEVFEESAEEVLAKSDPREAPAATMHVKVEAEWTEAGVKLEPIQYLGTELGTPKRATCSFTCSMSSPPRPKAGLDGMSPLLRIDPLPLQMDPSHPEEVELSCTPGKRVEEPSHSAPPESESVGCRGPRATVEVAVCPASSRTPKQIGSVVRDMVDLLEKKLPGEAAARTNVSTRNLAAGVKRRKNAGGKFDSSARVTTADQNTERANGQVYPNTEPTEWSDHLCHWDTSEGKRKETPLEEIRRMISDSGCELELSLVSEGVARVQRQGVVHGFLRFAKSTKGITLQVLRKLELDPNLRRQISPNTILYAKENRKDPTPMKGGDLMTVPDFIEVWNKNDLVRTGAAHRLIRV